ncbi:MAG TPA: PLP-dependent aminotransferase family protein [Kribbellaceae bacterium]
MTVEWTGLGPDLLLRLDRESGEPLGSQLERELREAIRDGRLAAGERLPSSRTLAGELGVSRGLVTECYAQLQAEGFLVTRTGSATRVSDCAQAPAATPPRQARTDPKLDVDFRLGVPDIGAFPRQDWSWALRKACRELPTDTLRYTFPDTPDTATDATGSPHLQRVLASYLGRVRRAAAEPDRVVVCTGFAQGLSLVVRALVRAGHRTVAVEDPGDRDHRRITEYAGAVVVPVPVDDHGVDTAALTATGARAVVLTPAHQAANGSVLAPWRRQELVAWANEHDAVIIEDDYDAEFRYDREPVGALQGLAPDRVALLGSASKSLAPALRIGWAVCPPWLYDDVAEGKLLTDRGSPLIEQYAFAAMIESGRYDKHLRLMRTRYAARRAALVASLARHAPGRRLTGLAAGFHAVLELPAGADEQVVVEEARRRGIGLYGMSGYRATSSGPPAVVLGFGNLSEARIERGIAAVADLLR